MRIRLGTYNIFEGAQDTYSLLKDFISRQDIDVLFLQEANGWHEGSYSNLEDFANETGLSHYVFGDSNTDCKLVIFSRWPIVESQVHTEGFVHGAVRATILVNGRTIEVWNTHLTPYDEDSRLAEAAFLAEHAKDGIIVGDLNSLSRHDAYTPAFARQLADNGNVRYGVGELRYDVTDFFAQAGYVDVAVARGANVNTFPARTDTEPNPPTARFDYVFAPPTLAEVIENVQVIKDPTTWKISDHFPLTVELALN